MDLLDLGVALLTGVGDIVFVNAGPGIGVRQNEVGCVAGGTDSGDGQPLLIEALAMNTHRVVFENSVLPDLMGLGDL